MLRDGSSVGGGKPYWDIVTGDDVFTSCQLVVHRFVSVESDGEWIEWARCRFCLIWPAFFSYKIGSLAGGLMADQVDPEFFDYYFCFGCG